MPRRPCLGRKPDGSLCGIPSEGSYCPAHDTDRARRNQKNREHGVHRAHWRRLRKRILEQRPLCEFQLRGCTGAATTVHLAEYMQGNHDRATERDCTACCAHCHGVVDAPRASSTRIQ